MFHNFLAFCIYITYTLSFTYSFHCNLYLYTEWIFLRSVFIYTKSKKINHVYVQIFLKPKYWKLSWAIKMEFFIFERVNNSIPTKLCSNLLNNSKRIIFSAWHNSMTKLCCALFEFEKTENWLRKLMHNFVMHSNESACRKVGVLGWTKSLLWINNSKIINISSQLLNKQYSIQMFGWMVKSLIQSQFLPQP